MQHDSQKSYHYPLMFPGILSQDQCTQLMAIVDRQNEQGQISDAEGNRALEARRSSIWRIDLNENPWLLEKIIAIVKTANQKYSFDLSDAIVEPPQLAIYDESIEGHYDWHLDIGPNHLTRKISISIPLNSDQDYDGGELEFHYGEAKAQPQAAGQAIAFPSYLLHRVKPVVKGRRYSLVTWIHGPHWR